MNWASFFTGLGSLAATTTGSLAAAGVIGNGSIPTTHITTQVPGGPIQTISVGGSAASQLFSTPNGSGFSVLLLIGLVLLGYATIKHFSKS